MANKQTFEIIISDEKASWHDNGDGNLPQRRLLPTRNGEKFKEPIESQILGVIDKITKSNTIKFNNKKGSISGKKEIVSMLQNILVEAKTKLPVAIKAVLLGYYKNGLSPVKFSKPYKKYSESYVEAIKAGRFKQYGKKISPVNMRLTGAMLRSLKVKSK